MRKLWTRALAPVFALAVFMLGTPAANAFGTEVLGCTFGTAAAWTANSCSAAYGDPTFSPSNLSGTYTFAWTATQNGSPITNPCSSGAGGACISSGCTSTSSTCSVDIAGSLYSSQTAIVTLVLTQSGQSRTIQASATVDRVRPCINGCSW
jgi:hypothetical protein